jgi:hypothetical protein
VEAWAAALRDQDDLGGRGALRDGGRDRRQRRGLHRGQTEHAEAKSQGGGSKNLCRISSLNVPIDDW